MEGLSLACEYKCSFIIIGLSDIDVKILQDKVLKDVKHRIGRHHKKRTNRIVVVPIDQSTSKELFTRILGIVGAYESFGFIVSTCNSNESFVIDVPTYICKLMQEVGGDISFSYTYAGDE